MAIVIQKEVVLKAIIAHKGTMKIAEALGVDRRTFNRLCALHGIDKHAVANGLDAEHVPSPVVPPVPAVAPLPSKKAEFVAPTNENLVSAYTGRFKAKSDTTHREFNRFVITSVQNDKPINREFYASLKTYCRLNKAKLLVLPSYYEAHAASVFHADPADMFFDDVSLSQNLRVLATLRVLPSIVDPFAGLDGLSKGDTIILAHPQTAMKTMPTLGEVAAQMHTTGSMCHKDIYSKTKTGYKAAFNHSLAALVVELGTEDSFHVRSLNCDENNGFYDISGYYQADTFAPLEYIEAIYTGDEHVAVADPEVVNATYLDETSIVKVLKPKIICRGDVLDFQSQNHHDKHDYLMQYGKFKLGLGCIESELQQMTAHLEKTTPAGVLNVMISSNHNDAFYKWLTTVDIKTDFTNALIYHRMTYLMMRWLKKSPSGVSYPNLLELWIEDSDFTQEFENSLEFIGRRNSYKIFDIEVSMHGDKGPNGSKGSPNGFSRLPAKSIVGHSHSPSIRLGCYTVGTSSLKDLSYTGGPSSWMHTHCIIYPNGKRQMINIINGKWHI